MSTAHTNRSNGSDKIVRYMAVYESGKVKQRAVTPDAPAPWDRSTGWGRAGAHAVPADAPSAPSERVKDPRKVAAGKARAAKAKAERDAKEQAAAKKAAAAKKQAATKKPAAKKGHGGARKGSGAKPVNGEAMEVIAFRGTPAQKAKFAKLGGGEWARARIDAATVK